MFFKVVFYAAEKSSVQQIDTRKVRQDEELLFHNFNLTLR